MTKLLQALNAIIKSLKAINWPIFSVVSIALGWFFWFGDFIKNAVLIYLGRFDLIDVPTIQYVDFLVGEEIRVVNTLVPLRETWQMFMAYLGFLLVCLAFVVMKRTLFFWK